MNNVGSLTFVLSEMTKPGCRIGAANWAECSGVPFGRTGAGGHARRDFTDTFIDSGPSDFSISLLLKQQKLEPVVGFEPPNLTPISNVNA